jgi:hypothetical protein
MNSRLPAIKKEYKKTNGFRDYSFDEKKKLLEGSNFLTSISCRIAEEFHAGF